MIESNPKEILTHELQVAQQKIYDLQMHLEKEKEKNQLLTGQVEKLQENMSTCQLVQNDPSPSGPPPPPPPPLGGPPPPPGPPKPVKRTPRKKFIIGKPPPINGKPKKEGNREIEMGDIAAAAARLAASRQGTLIIDPLLKRKNICVRTQAIQFKLRKTNSSLLKTDSSNSSKNTSDNSRGFVLIHQIPKNEKKKKSSIIKRKKLLTKRLKTSEEYCKKLESRMEEYAEKTENAKAAKCNADKTARRNRIERMKKDIEDLDESLKDMRGKSLSVSKTQHHHHHHHRHHHHHHRHHHHQHHHHHHHHHHVSSNQSAVQKVFTLKGRTKGHRKNSKKTLPKSRKIPSHPIFLDSSKQYPVQKVRTLKGKSKGHHKNSKKKLSKGRKIPSHPPLINSKKCQHGPGRVRKNAKFCPACGISFKKINLVTTRPS